MRLFIIFCFSFLWLKANAQEDVDSTSWELVIPVEISDSKSKVSNIVNLSRKDFLTMPASFDDPSRLLMKFPGFSNPNDQNNGIIYHGMPSWMSGWSLFGAEILNPNHLSAAGSFTDQISTSAGGVNAFSGQVIGEYTYRANPDIHTTNDYFAGVSDIKLRDPYKNQLTLNTSLIGMEAGLDLKGRHWNLMSNARYSTVGLLSLLGADFGGEEIEYQDINVKVGYSKENVKINLYSLFGSSSNFKDTLITAPFITEDYIARFQDEQLFVAGLNLEVEDENSLFESTINFSHENKYHVVGRYRPLSSQGVRKTNDVGSLLSTNSSYSFFTDKMDWEINYRSKYYYQGNQGRYSLNQIGLFNKLFINQRLILNSAISGLSFDEKNNVFGMNYALGLTWIDLSYNYKSSIKFSRNTQLGRTPYDLYGNPGLTKSLNLLVSLEDQVNKLKLIIFAHFFQDIPIYNNSSPSFGVLNLFNSIDLNSTSQGFSFDSAISNYAYIVGNSIAKNFTLKNKLDLDINWTFLQARYRENDSSIIRNQKLPFAARISINTIMTYYDIFKSGLDFSFSSSLRNGFNTGYTEPHEDSFSKKTPIYFRADLRINYTRSKNYKSMFSLDIQNLTNRQNIVGYFYDEIAEDILPKKQLGILPVLSWRIVI